MNRAEINLPIPSRIESADDYSHIVAQLNASWRVIECPGGIQWILQRRGSPERARRNDWRGRSYCRTREALISCTRAYCGAIDPAAAAVLAGLPTRVEPETPEDRAATLKAGMNASATPSTETTRDEDAVVLP
jgi:hypothetical protein